MTVGMMPAFAPQRCCNRKMMRKEREGGGGGMKRGEWHKLWG